MLQEVKQVSVSSGAEMLVIYVHFPLHGEPLL